MEERSGPAPQGCRCAAIGGEEASSECGREVSGCQGDRPRRSCEDSQMRRAMRICAPRSHAPALKMKVNRDQNLLREATQPELMSAAPHPTPTKPPPPEKKKKKKIGEDRYW